MAFPTGYTKYQVVTIASSQVSSDLTDFIVYVALSDLENGTADIFDTCRSDGGDIRVTKSDGTTELPREVVAIDTTGKTGELWIKYSGTLSSSSDTDIRIWYNGTDTEPTASSTYGSENVWTDYTAVLHLEEAVNNTANGYADATGIGNHGTGSSMSETEITSSPLEGKGQSFAGGSDAISITYNATANEETQPTLFTYSLWFNADATSSFSTFLDHGTSTTWVRAQRGGTNIVFNGVDSGVAMNTGTWYYVTVHGNDTANTGAIGVNGTYVSGSPSLTKTTGNTAIMYLSQNTTHSINGQADELRIRDSEVNEAWHDAEYVNQATPNTFYSVSAEQTGGGGGASFTPKVIMF